MSSAEQITAQGYFEERAPLQTSSTRYAVDDCLYSGAGEFANIVIIQNADYGRMLFLDNEIQSTSYDERIYHETLVHPIMRATAGIAEKRILVIGGAEGATVREVLRWSPNFVKHVDWVDIDGELVQICRDILRFPETQHINDDQRLHYYNEDIMNFLRIHPEYKYDCIIIDLPDPDPSEPVLYGPEFWTLIAGAMNPGCGVVSHAGPCEPGRQYVGVDIIQTGTENAGIGTGVTYHTLIPSFQGEWAFWMNLPPNYSGNIPEGLQVYDDNYQRTVFHWGRHW